MIKCFSKNAVRNRASKEGELIMMWGIVILFAVLSALLLSGKGSFLIAGYNTASEKEKARYNEKKLCRVTGGGLALITLLLLINALVGFDLPGGLGAVFPLGIVVICIGIVIASNTICRVKYTAAVPVIKDRKKEKRSARVSLVILVVTVIFVIIAMFAGSVNVSLDNDKISLHVSGWSDKEVLYSDIQSIDYSEQFTSGRRTNGLGNYAVKAGHFKNNTYGAYLLYSNNKCKEYIILDTTEGIVVFNAKDAEKTRTMYQEILERNPALEPSVQSEE